MPELFTYQGNELELFQHATHWKNYFSQQLKPYIKGDVLEAGAGIGSTTLLLNDGKNPSWLMLEPDDDMSSLLEKKLNAKEFPANCRIKKGTIENVQSTFDTIIYIDVLEHIATDAEELQKAAALLNDGGHIIVLSPAFQFLYSPFDKAIGHYRRYNKRMLRALTPTELALISNRYYDSVGWLFRFHCQ
jgi:2-polyprenyl-3-methyl-5-hydroxy-6-metoxy-1,4-benzoquinol methylase